MAQILSGAMVVVEKNSNMVHRAGLGSSVFGAPSQIVQREAIHHCGDRFGNLPPQVGQVTHAVVAAGAPCGAGTAHGILHGPEYGSDSHLVSGTAQSIPSRRAST